MRLAFVLLLLGGCIPIPEPKRLSQEATRYMTAPRVEATKVG